MLSEANKRLAVKVDALEKLASLSDSRERYQYTKDETVRINGLAYNNAGKYMRQVADSPGFSYNEDDDVLRVDKHRVLAAEAANDDAVEVVGHLATESEIEGESDQEWLDQALEDLEDVDEIPEPVLENVIRNKVVRARYPADIDETDTISGEAVENTGCVTNRQIARQSLLNLTRSNPSGLLRTGRSKRIHEWI